MKNWLVLLALSASCLGTTALTAAEMERLPIPANVSLPEWPKPKVELNERTSVLLRSGNMELIHSLKEPGTFEVRVSGKRTAIGKNTILAGYLSGQELKWLNAAEVSEKRTTVTGHGDLLSAAFSCNDNDAVHWKITQDFRPGRIDGSIDVVTAVTVDAERQVAFLPMFTIFPGAGCFGESKGQGLLAGLEYLENEPSSSTADLTGPAAKRQVPDVLKLTFPLMVIQSGERYVGLTWQMHSNFCPVFDSPDRLFASGGHVMGLLFPGSNGNDREEGKLLPRFTQVLHANKPLVLNATLLGGEGQSIVPALQQYTALKPCPSVETGSIDLEKYVALAAGGWLDSKIREGGLIRHAILGGNFPPGQAADAAMWMSWLAGKTSDASRAGRLFEVSSNVLAAIPSESLVQATVGHVRYPAPPLIYGHIEEAAQGAAKRARSLAKGFEPDGSLKYHPRKDGPDFAKTHYTNEANGLTSRSVLDFLEAAVFSGDGNLIEEALQKLRAMDKFHNGVPRGAQTWECPLHTPDILASAQMVRAYTLGFELAGEEHFLDEARYWAWTGVPFVYLRRPADGPVGTYSTIAVFGATQWEAPVWLGLPVQWCGLVYADALYRLVRHDPKGPWKRLADGITLSGIQQSWPTSDAETQGLLPDSFVLRAQRRNGPAINPATVQACAVRLLGQTPVYDFWCFRNNNILVHAPGKILKTRERSGFVSFEFNPAFAGPCYLLVNGFLKEPMIRINGKAVSCSSPNEFHANEGRLILQVKGKSTIEFRLAK